MTEPLVSAIVPVFNGARYVLQAIDSILAQTYPRLEVLVVDDGSTDDTANEVRSANDARIRYLLQAHRGAAAARNMGIRHAAGQFFAFLDADDLWYPDKLRVQLELLHGHANPDLVFGHYTEFVSPELGAGLPDSDPVPGYSSGTMLIERSAFERVGEFATEWRVGEFIDWYARAMEAGLRAVLIPQAVLHRRIHTTNTGVRERDARQVYAQVVSCMIRRRRMGKAAG